MGRGREGTNRLGRETSPYLLSHAHNPVDWYPWGEEALERARSEDRPILLSIGYAACHWCHVMERESFEDEEIARVMNEHFVCIKVDREERPDLDDIYMAATVAMNGSGGWPMTVFLTPTQQPFFAGTYFPPEDKYGRPGFRSLLERMAELWREQREAIGAQAAELTALVARQSEQSAPAPVSRHAIEQAVSSLDRAFDPKHGGFSPAPKFPAPAALSLLLQHHHHGGDEQALRMVRRTLDAMKDGGIYDHLGGGFARYSTDARWLVPHFEKMLYDNAQLARCYLDAFQVTKDAEYARVATETLDYVVREMQGEHGGYFSATDADSEGVEGKYFVWSKNEIADVLDDDDAVRCFCAHYDVTEGGNWEGHNVLNTPRRLGDVADELGMPVDQLEASLRASRAELLARRADRVPPLLDDKVLVSWNALMIGAMAEGARVLGDARYRASAERAAEYLFSELVRPDGGLFRTAREGKSHLDAYLEDYALLCDALVDLYEAGGAATWLDRAEGLAERMISDFGDGEEDASDVAGAFFHTAKAHESLLLRTREGHDGAMPNPNGIAARALARLSIHRQRDDLRERAEAAIRAYGRSIAVQPRAFATTLSAADFLMRGPTELAVVGPPEDEQTRAIWREIARHYVPHRTVAHGASDSHPMLSGKTEVDGKPALYVCRDFACRAPVTDPDQIGEALREAERSARAAHRPALQATGPRLATPEATEAWARRHEDLGAHAFTKLGRSGLRVSRIGFGAQRVTGADDEHRAALLAALTSGINLLDTAAYFAGGSSERLLGDVLSEAARRGDIARDAIVVVSKVELSRDADLEPQLAGSLARLGLDALDVCLGDGPERIPDDERHAELVKAFTFFEEQVKQGRIGAYGVSTQIGEIEPLLAAAREAGGSAHHLAVVEMPLNLLERGAQGRIEQAEREGLAVLAQRPLNALVAAKDGDGAEEPPELLRLADAEPPPGDAPPLPDSLRIVAELEHEYRTTFGPMLRTPPGSQIDPSKFFDWEPALASVSKQRSTLAQVDEIAAELVGPQVEAQLAMIDRAMRGPLAARWSEWRQRYLPALGTVVRALLHQGFAESESRLAPFRDALDEVLPDARRAEPLARKALWTALSQPGVTSVLCGLRRVAHVRDAVAVLGWEPLEAMPRLR